MKEKTFKAGTYPEFSRQFELIFFINATGKSLFVDCTVRMGKTYNAERFMIKFLQEDQGERNEIVIFCTEKNLLVDSSFLKISKELNPTERKKLVRFQKRNQQ
jgi:hypothetical protein